ncbi:MAG TPA: fibronectin type III domain-containing protein, partial [Acidimicrobiales bacterium]
MEQNDMTMNLRTRRTRRPTTPARRSIRRTMAALVLAGAGLAVAPMSPASAVGTPVTVAVSVPATIHSTGTASVATITLHNTATVSAALDSDAVKVIPACGVLNGRACGTADPGVIFIPQSGVESGSCGGAHIAVAAVPASTTGQVELTNTLTIAASSTCTVSLSLDVEHLPTIDANTKLPGLQTGVVVVAASHASSGSGSNGDSATTTVRGNPTIALTVPATARVLDNVPLAAAISGSLAPTGTLTLNVYDVGDTTCSTPIDSATTVGNGTSDPTVDLKEQFHRAGVFRITATYSQDANNDSVSTTCGAAGTTSSLYTNAQTPIFVAAEAGNASARVTWIAPDDENSPITSYTITPYIGATAQTPATFQGAGTTHTVTGLASGTTYTFTVMATNGAGPGLISSTSNAVTTNQAWLPFTSASAATTRIYHDLLGRAPTA